jgi:hypothetical protein
MTTDLLLHDEQKKKFGEQKYVCIDTLIFPDFALFRLAGNTVECLLRSDYPSLRAYETSEKIKKILMKFCITKFYEKLSRYIFFIYMRPT